jgi:hypothetical protein
MRSISILPGEAILMPPLALSDDEMDVIRRAAEPLDPDLRSPFLRTVVNLLAGEPEVGLGTVARACKAAQREFWKPPETARAGIGKYAR